MFRYTANGAGSQRLDGEFPWFAGQAGAMESVCRSRRLTAPREMRTLATDETRMRKRRGEKRGLLFLDRSSLFLIRVPSVFHPWLILVDAPRFRSQGERRPASQSSSEANRASRLA